MAQSKLDKLADKLNAPQQESNVKSYVKADDQSIKELQDSLNLPRGYIIAEEPKTQKTLVAFRPSLFAEIKAVAAAEGESFNNMIHLLLYEALDARCNKQ